MPMSKGTKMMAISRMTSGGETRGFNGTGRSDERRDPWNMPGRESRPKYERGRSPEMTEGRYYGDGGPRGERTGRYESEYDEYDMPESRRRGRDGRFIRGEGEEGPESRMIGYDRGEDGPKMFYGGNGNGGKLFAKGTMSYEPGKGDHEQMKHAEKYAKVDEHTADDWVRRMQNADGSTGPKFKIDQTEQLRHMYGMDCDKWEFMVAMNMMYSDYCEVARHLGVDRVDFYAMMAKAFLCDEDAGENKLQKYMEKVVK